VDSDRSPPLFFWHLIHRSIIRRPDTMVAHHDVHLAKARHGCGYELLRGLRGRKFRLHSSTLGLATTFVGELICVTLGALIVEKTPGAERAKHLHTTPPTAACPPGNNRHFSVQ